MPVLRLQHVIALPSKDARQQLSHARLTSTTSTRSSPSHAVSSRTVGNSTFSAREAGRRKSVSVAPDLVFVESDIPVTAYVLHTAPPECMSMTNFVIYLIGTLLVVAGLAYGASRLGVSQVWIVAGALVIIGLGLMGGIVKTRQKDPAS